MKYQVGDIVELSLNLPLYKEEYYQVWGLKVGYSYQILSIEGETRNSWQQGYKLKTKQGPVFVYEEDIYMTRFQSNLKEVLR